MGILSTILPLRRKKKKVVTTTNNTSFTPKPLGMRFYSQEKIQAAQNPQTVEQEAENYEKAYQEICWLEEREMIARNQIKKQTAILRSSEDNVLQTKYLKHDYTRAKEIQLARILAQQELDELVEKSSDDFKTLYSIYPKQPYASRIKNVDGTRSERLMLMRKAEKKQGNITLRDLTEEESPTYFLEKASKLHTQKAVYNSLSIPADRK